MYRADPGTTSCTRPIPTSDVYVCLNEGYFGNHKLTKGKISLGKSKHRPSVVEWVVVVCKGPGGGADVCLYSFKPRVGLEAYSRVVNMYQEFK